MKLILKNSTLVFKSQINLFTSVLFSGINVTGLESWKNRNLGTILANAQEGIVGNGHYELSNYFDNDSVVYAYYVDGTKNPINGDSFTRVLYMNANQDIIDEKVIGTSNVIPVSDVQGVESRVLAIAKSRHQLVVGKTIFVV